MNKINNIWKYKNTKPFSNETPAWVENDIINEIFNRLNNDNIYYEKKCIEFGASNGIFLSNTRNLILNGWESIQIESNSEKFLELKNNYSDFKGVICLNSFIEESGKNSLDQTIFDSWGICNVSLISIDIDGKDFSILKSIKNYKPILYIVECNAHLEQHKDEGITTIYNWAIENNYDLICYTGNLFLLNSDYTKIINFDILTPKESYELFLENSTKEGIEHQKRTVDIQTFYMR